VSPEERLKEYVDQCKGLPKTLQAKFWLDVLDGDPDVRALVESERARKVKRRRRS